MAFCALSIAFRSVELEDPEGGFGSRWYAVLIFAYTLLVRIASANFVVHDLHLNTVFLSLQNHTTQLVD